MEELEDIVFQALGEASMCWSERPKGAFDCANAKRIGQEEMQALEKHMAGLQHTTNLDDEALKGLLIEALQAEGAHQKQYLLWKIAEFLEFDVSGASDERGARA